MGRSGGVLVALMAVLLLAAAPAVAAAPAGEASGPAPSLEETASPALAAEAAEVPTPSCAEGPTREGEVIVGTPCADRIVVPPSVAYVDGGSGNDTILAAPGPVTHAEACATPPHCGVGSQEFVGGSGNDTVFGERGNDILRGGEGNDRLYGGIGDDVLEGGPGNDLLSGGFGADAIDGGEGSDFVRGDGTVDTIVDSGTGSTDVDTLSYSTGATPGFGPEAAIPNPNTEHPGFPSGANGRGVYLDLGALAEGNGNDGAAASGGGVDNVAGGDFERIIGTPFADYIVGSKPGQTIYGGGGGDVLVGGAGSQLIGGPDKDDCFGGATATCEEISATGATGRTEPKKVEVGEMVEGATELAELYLVGAEKGTAAELTDQISVATAGTAPNETVTFTRTGGSVAFEAAPGCALANGGAAVTCALTAPLDSVTVAGLAGNDVLEAPALPETTSLVLLGGNENDTLVGGAISDDTLVDGPGNDVLRGGLGDDALLNGEGRDELFGEGGNDLLISTVICEGDTVDGDEGRDNASWAKYKGGPLGGVDARLDQGLAGEPGAGGQVSCPPGRTPDNLVEIEDLEGSPESDVLYGDAGPNQLLGHQGEDTYFSGAGEDLILANSKSRDATIDCGPDFDEAILDLPEVGDPSPIECEKVRNAPPGEYEVPPVLPAPVVSAPPVTPPAPVAPKPDRTPPRTKLLRRPARLIRVAPHHLASVVFRFSANERSRFECKLDAKPYRSCRSPLRAHLKAGAHTFRVYAIDSAGNRDRTPALFKLRVVSLKRHHR